MPVSDFIIPGIGAAANIVSGAIARGQATRDFNRQRQLYLEDREYNTPANQLKRIHEAGLPSAAYFGGSASSQSAPFAGQINETDNKISEAGDALSKYHSTRLERIGVEAAEQNLAILKNQRLVSDAETKDQLEEVADPTKFNVDSQGNLVVGQPIPRVVESKRKQDIIQNLEIKAKQLENDLKALEKEVKGATTEDEIKSVKARLDNMLKDLLLKEEDLKMKTTENKYRDSELQYAQTIRDLRREFWGKLRTGTMPNFREILNILMLALENRL